FGDCGLHHGICFTTDMPTNKVILDKLLTFQEMYLEEFNQDKIQQILNVQLQVYLENQKLHPNSDKLSKYHYYLNQLRKHTVHYSEESTLMNAEVLGMEFILKLKRTLPDYIFKTSILNIRPDTVEHGFYPYLTERHLHMKMITVI